MNDKPVVGSSNERAALQAILDYAGLPAVIYGIAQSALRTPDETSDIQHLMAALVDQEGVLNECETLLREALDDRGVNVGFDDRLIAYWAKTKALSDWRTRDLRLTQKANDPLAQLEDDATFGEIVEEIQTGKMAVKEREGKL